MQFFGKTIFSKCLEKENMVFRAVTVTLALQKVTAKNRELENIDFYLRRIDIDKS